MPTERLSIAVSESCAQTIRELAVQNNTTVSAQIRAALKAYVEGAIYSRMDMGVIDALEARVASIEQRLKDKDEIITAKNETILALSEALDISLKRENVVMTDDERKDSL